MYSVWYRSLTQNFRLLGDISKSEADSIAARENRELFDNGIGGRYYVEIEK